MMPRRTVAQWLAENPDLAAMTKELDRVASQCRIIEVDDTKPPKKERRRKAPGSRKNSDPT